MTITSEVRSAIIEIRKANAQFTSRDMQKALRGLDLRVPGAQTIGKILRKEGLPLKRGSNKYPDAARAYAIESLSLGARPCDVCSEIKRMCGRRPTPETIANWLKAHNEKKVRRMPGSPWKRIEHLRRGNWKYGEPDTGRPMSDIYVEAFDILDGAGIDHRCAIDGIMSHFTGGKIRAGQTFWNSYKRSQKAEKRKKAA